MASQPVAREKLDAFGIDAVCDEIAEGIAMTAICEKVGVNIHRLCEWLAVDAHRSARAREARQYSARMWEELATAVIVAAPDAFGLAKAKELAHHYRWRASKIAPREYGDKLDVAHTGDVTVQLVTGVSRVPGADQEG